jgi:hypothetical protein
MLVFLQKLDAANGRWEVRWRVAVTGQRQTTNNDDLQLLNHSSPVRCIIVALPTPIQLVTALMVLHVLLLRHLRWWLLEEWQHLGE